MQSAACILNSGQNAWAFEHLAAGLADAAGIPVQQEPSSRNYLLACDTLPEQTDRSRYFVPPQAIRLASDKRLIAEAFARDRVPTPHTLVLETLAEAKRYADQHNTTRWCLKYPDSCGGAGHRHIDQVDRLPASWPRPLILQEYIEMRVPEVYRTYAVADEVFGWIARRFPRDKKASAWVAHARGARYEPCGPLPKAAHDIAEHAFKSAGLLQHFGCVDLIRRPDKQWVALEVGTDGWMNHVDREIGVKALEAEITNRLATAIKQFAET